MAYMHIPSTTNETVLIPYLVRHVPPWFPGVKFKQTAAKWAQLHMEVVQGPFEWALACQVHFIFVFYLTI
jgi:hypothetical protein